MVDRCHGWESARSESQGSNADVGRARRVRSGSTLSKPCARRLLGAGGRRADVLSWGWLMKFGEEGTQCQGICTTPQ